MKFIPELIHLISLYPSGNSDYKSASSVERIEAFIALGRPDPVQYEDEIGPVPYEVAKASVEKVYCFGSAYYRIPSRAVGSNYEVNFKCKSETCNTIDGE